MEGRLYCLLHCGIPKLLIVFGHDGLDSIYYNSFCITIFVLRGYLSALCHGSLVSTS